MVQMRTPLPLQRPLAPIPDLEARQKPMIPVRFWFKLYLTDRPAKNEENFRVTTTLACRPG